MNLSTLLRWSLGLLAVLASLQLAVVLIALVAGVIAWATFIERAYGADAAHFAIYDTNWFTALNGLLAANVLSAVLIRFPWQRRQTGFVVTHAGILVLLVGCLVSQRYGVEAQLPIFEGHTAHRALRESSHFELQVTPATTASKAAPAAGPSEVISVPFVAGPFGWNQYAELSWFPWHVPYRSQGRLYDEDGIELEVLDYQKNPQPSVRVRLTVDGAPKEFDLVTASDDAPEETRRQVIEGKGRQVTISIRPDEVDLGFQVYLQKFQRKLDPGSGMASHYSSVVDFLDLGNPPRKLQTNVLVTLNAPVDFADPRSGRTFRLFQAGFEPPSMPGDPEFDQLVGKDRSRDQVFLSRLSVNCDSGRGLKYAGSLLIVAGIIMVYYLRAYFARKENNDSPRPLGEGQGVRALDVANQHGNDNPHGNRLHPSSLPTGEGTIFCRILLAMLIFALPAGACRAAEDAKSGWIAWRHMPVFGEGRVAPLDTFARETVEAICGCADPTLRLPGEEPRTFTAAELLFSWLAEPEKWEQVPFLAAPDQQLREDLLGLSQPDGNDRSPYVSPAAVENNAELGHRWAELEKRADTEGKNFRLTGLDKKIKALVDACSKFRMLTFNPSAPQEMPQRFYTRLRLAANAWRKLAGDLQGAQRISHDDETRRLMVESSEALQQLLKQIHGGEFSLEKIEPPVVAFSRASDQLAGRLTDADDMPLNALAAELRHQAAEMYLALYDNGETLCLVPALSTGALEMNRDPSDDAKPWLSFQALIYGSTELLGPYPQPEVQEVRKAWSRAKTAYDKFGAADPATSVAISDFVTAVRTLSEQIEPLRQQLPIRHRDQELLAATAYPPPGATDAEVFYNRLNPFFWSWVVSLTATLCLLLAVGPLRKPLFWLGVAVLATAQVLTIAGLALRGYVTGLVPLTGMFETVVFVALSVAIFGLWFTLLPLFWPGLQAAWRLSTKAKERGTASVATRLVHGLLLLLRLGLTVLVFLGLARWPGWFGLRVFDLLPPTAMGTTVPSANDLLIWLAGLCVLAAIIYFLPRAILTLAVGAFTVPSLLARRQGDAMEQTFQRRLFILAGAIVSFVAMVLAYYAPASVMHRNIGSVTPILRDNYWLAVHVVTIMASYASAAIALILGNIALGYYLFGRYTLPPLAASQSAARRPPQACAVLAGFTYTAIQITVLLLTAGTILGALWADKSWGRFWGWDPKEAWALISLLVYLVILHARYVGWSGNFGMTVAAVFGFSAVLFTWYLVNFFWGSGMHSYSAGAGGQWTTISAMLLEQWKIIAPIVLDWLFLAAAAVRCIIETGGEEGWGMKHEG